MKYFRMASTDVESLVGKTLTFRATVTNFLSNSASNTTQIVFSSLKKLEILDLQDIYTLYFAQNNTIQPRVRIPYCAADDRSS